MTDPKRKNWTNERRTMRAVLRAYGLADLARQSGCAYSTLRSAVNGGRSIASAAMRRQLFAVLGCPPMALVELDTPVCTVVRNYQGGEPGESREQAGEGA